MRFVYQKIGNFYKLSSEVIYVLTLKNDYFKNVFLGISLPKFCLAYKNSFSLLLTNCSLSLLFVNESEFII